MRKNVTQVLGALVVLAYLIGPLFWGILALITALNGYMVFAGDLTIKQFIGVTIFAFVVVVMSSVIVVLGRDLAIEESSPMYRWGEDSPDN